MTNKKILAYYASPGRMTGLTAEQQNLLSDLPNTVPELVAVVQGLAIHQYVAERLYGVSLAPERIDRESNIRELGQLFDAIIAPSDQPLTTPRQPEQRLVGVCHHFAVLLTGILRAKGIPARCRYGFGNYFNPGFYEDHSLCEYWNAKEERWILVDPQFDAVWRKELHIQHNVLDVPRDHFLTASDAWQKCRSGELDASKFGIFNGDLRGLWFIAGNIIKDIAALNKVEMLQWDAWTGMPRPNNTMQDKKRLSHFDELARAAQDPDAHFDQLQQIYADSAMHVKVPARVFNAMRRHLEWVDLPIEEDS